MDNVTILLDGDATREAISNAFLSYANGTVKENDRILVFFAGHGHTTTGKRGEVGYLVPVEGTTNNLASLMRWDALIRDSELIPAKHILLIMDACYGGVALQRGPGLGGMRFLKSMMQRYARQVLTAGKADETVADAGGPLPNHSIFTGHLLEGLEGKAATPDKIISANNLMAYVYDKVAKDINSNQTPHHGFVDGDGDFIFTTDILSKLSEESETDKDVLIEQIAPVTPPEHKAENVVDIVKDYIFDSHYAIKLHDLVVQEIRKVQYETEPEKFPLSDQVTIESFAERMRAYESIIRELQSVTILLSHWGGENHAPLLARIISRVTEKSHSTGGKVNLLGLRYYPTLLLLYSGGIAAIDSEKYSNLLTLFTANVGSRHSGEKGEIAIITVVERFLDLERTNIFKSLPGYERNYVPRSEYVFKVIQPMLDDLLFLGDSYESLFDRFEVFWALAYADLDRSEIGGVWGPPGRFAYKLRREGGPFWEVVSEADLYGDDWPPLKAGFFGRSYDRFKRLADAYAEKIANLHWG